MDKEVYFLYRDSCGRFLLQNLRTGLVAGLLFPAMAGESARAFSYDYGSIWEREQIINLDDFVELAEMPFFTIESCYYFDQYFLKTECEPIQPMLGAYAKFLGFQINASSYWQPTPIVWQYQIPNPKGFWRIPIFDLWVNEQGCFSGDRDGRIVGINHQGEPIQQCQLSREIRCLQEHQENLYFACDDGKIYEFSGKLPEVVYDLNPPHYYQYTYLIYALHQADNYWFIADGNGKLTCTDTDWQTQWQIELPVFWLPFCLLSDAQFLYQGYYAGLICLTKSTGQIYWQYETEAPVLCAEFLRQTTGNQIIFGCGDRQIYAMPSHSSTEAHIKPKIIFKTEGMPYCLTTTENGQYILVGDYDRRIYVIDLQGNLHTTFILEKGAAMALKIWQKYLYVATTEGSIICLSLSSW